MSGEDGEKDETTRKETLKVSAMTIGAPVTSNPNP